MFHVAWIPVRCQGPQTPTPGGARESKGPRTPVPVPCAATHGHPEARGGTPAVWLQAREQKVNSNSWAVVLTVSENKGEAPRQAVILFSAEGHSVEVTVRQEPEDPVLRVTVPGAYGAEGGTLVYERGSTQISRFTEADVFRFSLLFPEQVKAAVIQVPASLEEGQRVSVGYKVVEKDRTLVNTSYPDALVLRVKDGFVWIKLREDLYFVIKK